MTQEDVWHGQARIGKPWRSDTERCAANPDTMSARQRAAHVSLVVASTALGQLADSGKRLQLLVALYVLPGLAYDAPELQTRGSCRGEFAWANLR